MRKNFAFERILGGLQEVGRKEIRRDFRPDSCIASTRVVIRVLGHFGVEATSLPVRVFIYNSKFVEAVLRSDPPPFEETQEYSEWFQKTGAWAIGLGLRDKNEQLTANRYEGHLVAVLPKHEMLIDASLDQANRPQYGIILPEVLVAKVNAGFVAGQTQLDFRVNECLVKYKRIFDDGFHKKGPDWTDSRRTKRATKAIVKFIKKRA